MRVDLHIHTTASDGRWSPEQLIDEIKRQGIDGFAVTDHDTIRSVKRSEELARQEGLAFLRGVEISSKQDGRLMHILAYGFDMGYRPFQQFLERNETELTSYDDTLIQLLVDAGYSLDKQEYDAYTWDQHRGGWKSLNFLVDKGLCTDVHSFFGELFTGDLEVAFPDFPPPEAVVEAIQQAGGVPIWAHPANSLSKYPDFSPHDDEGVVAEMVAAGIQGLECFACHHDPVWTARCLAWAERYDLLITGGSDSHGGFAHRQLGYPEIHLGQLRLGQLAASLMEGN